MHSGPSKTTETVVAILVPPACREEVLGDLHERYSSPLQYGRDALRTVPLVIFSRIRRTADPQVLLIQAFALYMSFVGAAWFMDAAFLSQQLGLLRLAVPAAIALLGLILDDTYAKPGWRPPVNLARAPVVGLGLALALQGIFQISKSDLAISSSITSYGYALSFLLSSAVRMLFPPAANQPQGGTVPADRLKQSDGPPGNPETSIRALKEFAAVVAAVIAGSWMANGTTLQKPRIVTLFLVLLLLVLSIAYQVWKRG